MESYQTYYTGNEDRQGMNVSLAGRLDFQIIYLLESEWSIRRKNVATETCFLSLLSLYFSFFPLRMR